MKSFDTTEYTIEMSKYGLGKIFGSIPGIAYFFVLNRKKLLSEVKKFIFNRSNKHKAQQNGIIINALKNDNSTTRFKTLYYINKGSETEVQFNIHMDGNNIKKKVDSYYFYLYCRNANTAKTVMNLSSTLVKDSANKLSFCEDKQSVRKHLDKYLNEFIEIQLKI